MSSRLAKLLLGVMVAILAGFALFPVMFPSYTEKKVAAAKPKPVEVKRNNKVDDWQRDDSLVDSDDDDAWKTDDRGDDDDEARRRGLAAQDDDSYDEEDVPEDPRQKKVTEARVHAQFTSALAHAKQLAKSYEKLEPKRFTKVDYPAEKWADPDNLYQSLAEKTLGKLGKLDDNSILDFMEKPENCLDLARITLIRKVGTDALREFAAKPKGGELLEKLSSDLNWIQGMLYSGPTNNLAQGLDNMLKLYARVGEDWNDPVVQRIITTTALEFAREGWSEKDMLGRFDYYYNSYKQELLNDVFSELQYWDMRLVTGSREGDSTNPSWGGPKNLAWMRDNVRLPADRYLGAEGQLQYRLRNVAGDSVFSAAYLAPIWDYTDHTTAWAHREIGGVCGALSHYATYAALASGIPATTVGEPGHCSYAVRVGNEWKAGNAIYWQKGIHKNMWGESGWDYLILMQDLYSDRFTTLVSDQMIAMADFLGARKKMTASFSTYEIAIKVQPLNWPGLKRYSGYLKIKAPNDADKWQVLHDTIVDGMGDTHHFAAATLLARRVYPNLVPLVKDRNKLNKMFAGLFKNFKDWGTNRWDISEVLDTQMATCKTPEEQKAYLRECLRVLMSQPDYSGAVLTWGLGYISKLPEGDGKVQDEFTNLLIASMRRTSTDKKNKDATWSTLGEAMYAAAKNHERRTFQAIGKLTYTKCKDKFPKKGPRFRAFPGKVVSTTALINTATTIGDTSDCALHWGVLQRFGGSMPGKFEGTSGVTVDLDSKCEINGVICLTKEKTLKNDRAWYLEISDDGQNWRRVPGNGMVDGGTLRFDTRKEKPACKFLRMLREGDKYEPGIAGFYVYGKNLKN